MPGMRQPQLIKGILKNYYFLKIIVVFQDICPIWGSTCKVIRDPLKIVLGFIFVFFYLTWHFQNPVLM